jgi:RimJ/RimL family protein N-acetyltransferase
MGTGVLIHAMDGRGEPFEVRTYTPADRLALDEMYADFEPKRGAQGLPPADATAIVRWLDRILATGTHLIAILGGRLRGHVMLMPMEPGTVELANFVHQAVRERGIGTALNRIAIDAARACGAQRVWLSVEPANRAAIRSYERAGFRRLPGSLWAPEMEMAIELGAA